jgi:Phage holin.
MDYLAVGNVFAITVICVLVTQAVKKSPVKNKWLPIVSGTVGGMLGVVAFVTGVAGFPATDAITAVAVGIVSGLAGTGSNQVWKQLTGE